MVRQIVVNQQIMTMKANSTKRNTVLAIYSLSITLLMAIYTTVTVIQYI